MLAEGNLLQLHLIYPPSLACEEAPNHFPTRNRPLGFHTTEPYLHKNKNKNQKKVMWGGIGGMTRRESLKNWWWVTVGFNGGEDLIFEADLLDVLDIRVPQEEEFVSEHEVRLLSSLLAIHGGCRLGGQVAYWLRNLFGAFWLRSEDISLPWV